MNRKQLVSILKQAESPTQIPLDREVMLLETSKALLDQIEKPEFQNLNYDAKFSLIYMTGQVFAGTPNGELEAPRLIPE